MPAYYNEIDPYAAEWLRNLMVVGHIADGYVDERSILDVRPDDLKGFEQCHFFAGIGVWSLALRRAGWADDRPVWTGSCPCQPFSAAGKGGGFADERHLWPAFFHLIGECRPGVVLGEQVASKDGLAWLDLVSADLEGARYASGAIDLCAAGVGAPHIRQRLWWFGKRLADADHERHVGVDALLREETGGRFSRHLPETAGRSSADGLADDDPRLEGHVGVDALLREETGGRFSRHLPETAGPTNGVWRDADWLHCRDGRWRPVEPGTFPLAHGASARVGRLRAYGNAIVAQAAQEFVEGVMECL